MTKISFGKFMTDPVLQAYISTPAPSPENKLDTPLFIIITCIIS